MRLSIPIAVFLLMGSLAPLTWAAHAGGPGQAPMTGYILDPIQETTTDPDADGAIDAVRLTATIQANVSGTWYLSAFFYINGTSAGNQTQLDLAIGQNDVTLEIPGWLFRRSQSDGPYAGSLSIYHYASGYGWTRNYRTAAYRWTDFELRAEFLGGFTAQGIDADTDGLFNYLEVSGTLNIGEARGYWIRADLRSQSGSTWIAFGQDTSNRSVGTATFRLWFSGDAIRTYGLDGPYNVSFELWDDKYMTQFDAEWFLTGPFAASQFAHAPIAFGAQPSDAAVDIDGNGIPDVLRVTVPVVVAIPGEYQIYGRLDVDPITTVSGQGKAMLPAGPGSLVVDFDGWEIYQRYVDGPYPATLYVYETKSLYQIQTSHTTAAYVSWSWDNPYGNFRTPFEVIPKDTDGDGEYNEVEVRATLDMKVGGEFGLYFYLSLGGDTLNGFETFSGGPGPAPVNHTFPGWWIRAIEWNGTYRFSILLPSVQSVYEDLTFTWDRFDPSIRLTGSPGFTPVDTDGDGEYNQLVATFPLYVEEGGAYSLSLSAYDGLSNYAGDSTTRLLTEGPLDLVLRLSGISLRTFQGDASLRFVAWRPVEWSSVEVLTWAGTYGIPDPTAFESARMVTVTFDLVSPEPLICCSSVMLASYPDVYFPWGSGSAGMVTMTIPDLDYTFIVQGTGAAPPYSSYVGFGTLIAPLSGTIRVDMSLAVYAETTEIAFRQWSAGSAWTNRTLTPGASFRFASDVNGDADGMTTEAEILAQIMGGSPWSGLEVHAWLDGVPVTATTSHDAGVGAGPPPTAAPAGYGRLWELSAPATPATVHRLTVNVSYRWATPDVTVAVRVPVGWTVAIGDAPPEVEVTMVGLREVRLRPTVVDPVPYTVNLTATATATPSVIMGRVVDDAASPLQGAAVALTLAGTEVASGTTTAEGRFTFSGLAAGTYTLTARAPGFSNAAREVVLAVDEFVDLGDIAMERSSATGTVRGRVVDPEGQGIPGARISLTNSSGEVAATTTELDGAFSITAVPLGPYSLRAAATGFLDRELTVTVLHGELDLGTLPMSRATGPSRQDTGLLLVAAAGIAMALVAAGVLGLLLWRRRSKGRPG